MTADHDIDFLSGSEIFDTAIVVMTVLFALDIFYNIRTSKYY